MKINLHGFNIQEEDSSVYNTLMQSINLCGDGATLSWRGSFESPSLENYTVYIWLK